jgi:hypothetical protein
VVLDLCASWIWSWDSYTFFSVGLVRFHEGWLLYAKAMKIIEDLFDSVFDCWIDECIIVE